MQVDRSLKTPVAEVTPDRLVMGKVPLEWSVEQRGGLRLSNPLSKEVINGHFPMDRSPMRLSLDLAIVELDPKQISFYRRVTRNPRRLETREQLPRRLKAIPGKLPGPSPSIPSEEPIVLPGGRG